MQTYIQGADWEFSSGDFVRKLRRVAGLSQRELAQVSGVSRSLIAKIESGTFDPKVGQLQLLFDQVCWAVTVTDVNGYLVLPLREFEGNSSCAPLTCGDTPRQGSDLRLCRWWPLAVVGCCRHSFGHFSDTRDATGLPGLR